MSLHGRGHRPNSGERVNLANGGTDTRRWWVLSWRYRREHGGDCDIMDAFDSLAEVCLDDRLAPDPLFWAQAARIIRVTGLGTGNGDRMAPGLLLARRGEQRAGIPADGRG